MMYENEILMTAKIGWTLDLFNNDSQTIKQVEWYYYCKRIWKDLKR